MPEAEGARRAAPQGDVCRPLRRMSPPLLTRSSRATRATGLGSRVVVSCIVIVGVGYFAGALTAARGSRLATAPTHASLRHSPVFLALVRAHAPDAHLMHPCRSAHALRCLMLSSYALRPIDAAGR